MKLHDVLGVGGFALIIAATYLGFGLAPAMYVAGGGLLLSGLMIARSWGR